MTRTQRAVLAVVRPIRRLLYAAGVRPRLGSIWHSPSLHMLAAGRELTKRVVTEIEEQLALIEEASREIRRRQR